MSEPVIPCPTCPEGWRPLHKEHCADCYEGQIERLRAALAPFASKKLPSSRRTEIAYNRHGLRCAMSPLQIAQTVACAALAAFPPAVQTPIENKGGGQS